MKRYVTSAKWDDIVGLHFEWTGTNPLPGTDWKIVERCPSEFPYEGQYIFNFRMNKFWATPVSASDPKVLCMFNYVILGQLPEGAGLDIDYSTADLTDPAWKFYST